MQMLPAQNVEKDQFKELIQGVAVILNTSARTVMNLAKWQSPDLNFIEEPELLK
ncbi:hypothetical protein [Gimesia maris]|uniref:hypothetical protein n=1 Tax=Gimesia maris TaxID=122 RepID=UPI0030DB966A|tara:strand:- start:209 stop:370 length:162 start_codon:yes stop_codon:yes gene_type:complete